MVVKTKFSKEDFNKILLNYNLGEYKSLKPISKGTVQTNIILQTTKGKFVFRYYENRSKGSVLFESSLIKYLKDKNYPCPTPFKNIHGKFVGIYNKKPYVIFEFVEGKHIKNPNENQKKQLIKKVAQLQNITKNYRPSNKRYRWNYSVRLCNKLAQKEAVKIGTVNSREKLKWLKIKLSKLNLPKSLPKGICHCDFHFSNVLFLKNEFNALIDFDDANYTFLMFDLIGLIESWAWPHNKTLNFKKAKGILKEYSKYRKLNNNEKRNLFDLYKLSILIDCVWYFKRGNVKDFYEKRKIDYLNKIGREEFYKKLFSISKI